ncbi:MAG: hypothetical protein H7Y11_15955 [Armatimonadetes bacterium]|nr:hypothetical protein [Anaerolineae bacterium]
MFKFMLMFTQPPDVSTFENSYQDLLALIERMPHIQRRQVVHITGSPAGAARLYRVLEVYFADETQMRAALLSAAGQEAGGEIQRFPVGTFELVFAEVYEEAGGNTHASA